MGSHSYCTCWVFGLWLTCLICLQTWTPRITKRAMPLMGGEDDQRRKIFTETFNFHWFNHVILLSCQCFLTIKWSQASCNSHVTWMQQVLQVVCVIGWSVVGQIPVALRDRHFWWNLLTHCQYNIWQQLAAWLSACLLFFGLLLYSFRSNLLG